MDIGRARGDGQMAEAASGEKEARHGSVASDQTPPRSTLAKMSDKRWREGGGKRANSAAPQPSSPEAFLGLARKTL
eukprot:13064074-Alexandrium_andersonii.AAC.1